MRFGGILPDKKDNFFPPDLTVEGETMITRKEYEAQILKDIVETQAEPETKKESAEGAQSETTTENNKEEPA